MQLSACTWHVGRAEAIGLEHDIMADMGVTCSQAAIDPFWKGDCKNLNHGQPGWGATRPDPAPHRKLNARSYLTADERFISTLI